MATAQLPGELAVGEEKERIHTTGSDIGTFWVSGPIIQITRDEEGSFREAYSKALAALMDHDSRVRDGEAFAIHIVN